MLVAPVARLDHGRDRAGSDAARQRLPTLVLLDRVVFAGLARELRAIAHAVLDRILEMRVERLRRRIPRERSAPGVAERGDHDVLDIRVGHVVNAADVSAEPSACDAMKLLEDASRSLLLE